MNKKIRAIGAGILAAVWLLLTGVLWFGKAEDYTLSERRKLAQMPKITAKTILNGTFMPAFEDYTLDQFPLRDSVRQLKSLFHYYVLNQKDNNGIYLVEDMVAKLEYPMNEASVAYALGRLQYLQQTYLEGTDCKIYAAMIPDKGYYLAEELGYPAMDYEAMQEAFRNGLPWARHVDLTDVLSAQDYYRTDTHWRQERILGVAQRLCQGMGAEPPGQADYTALTLEEPFYGVYFGQAALPMKPETLTILQSDILEACRVYDPVTGTETKVYNMDKRTSPDLYDVFLSGAQPLLVVENPNAETDRELILFRDSYGSSLAPLLLGSYRQVTLVDIRYIASDQVGEYVVFDDQDVLFLYSTLILNNGRSLK